MAARGPPAGQTVRRPRRRPCPDGDLSPRHPRGQPRPQATQGRTGPVGSVAPHHARPHPGSASALERTKAPRRCNRPARQIDLFLVVLVLGALGVGVWIVTAFWGATRVHVDSHGHRRRAGPHPRGRRGARHHASPSTSRDELFRVRPHGRRRAACSRTSSPRPTAAPLRIRPADLVETELVEQALAEGEHRIELSVGRMFLGDSTFTWSYVVDSIAPTLDVPASLDPVPIDEPVTVEGDGRGGRGAPPRRRAARQRRRLASPSTSTPRPPASLAFAADRRGRQPHHQARRGAGRSTRTTSHAVHVSARGLGRRRAARRRRWTSSTGA